MTRPAKSSAIPAAPAAGVVASAGVRVEVTPPHSALTYTLEALSFGESGKITAALVDRQRPSRAVENDVLRQVAREVGGEEAAALCDLVDAYEEADDTLQATYAAFGKDDPKAVFEATRAMLTASRGRELVLNHERVWAHPRMSELRRRRAEGDRAEAETLVRAALRGIRPSGLAPEGAKLPEWRVGDDGLVTPEFVAALPAAHVAALASRVSDLTAPSSAAAKN